jgi:hypothetical protein
MKTAIVNEKEKTMNGKTTTMRRTQMLVAVAMAIALGLGAVDAARAATLRYDFDATIDFSSWKSWAWKQPKPESGSSIIDARIRRALDSGFTAAGYDEAAPDQADFLIDYRATGYREVRIDEGFGPPLRRSLRVGSQPMGVLTVDVFDRKTGKLAWHGVVSDAIASDPEDADEATAKAVAKLLKKFPPSQDPR